MLFTIHVMTEPTTAVMSTPALRKRAMVGSRKVSTLRKRLRFHDRIFSFKRYHETC